MKDAAENDVSLPDISGDEKQEAAVAKLCQDCQGLLQRVLDLVSGKSKPLKRLSSLQRSLEKRLESDPRFEDMAPFQNMPEDNSMPHKSRRDDLQISSDLGCLMCMWFLQSLQSRQENTVEFKSEQWLKRPASVEKMSRYHSLGQRCRDHYYLTVRCPAESAPKPLPNAQLRGDEKATLIVDVIPDSNHTKDLLYATKILGNVTPSSNTWKLISIWLQICVEDHPGCKYDVSSKGTRQEILPTRLLDIQATDVVRLVDIEHIDREDDIGHPRYAALSHCWGMTHDPQLNKSTLGELTKGVPTKDLPELFRDAIFIAKSIGIPYLWIDSLCIIQDSRSDWNRESVKMGAIYKHCFICIAATAAPDNNASLLRRHKVGWPRPLVYGNLLIQGDVGLEPTDLYILEPGWCKRMRFLSQWVVDTAPLNQRSWVLQERTFAPRTLHCTSDEFVWECRVGMRSESHLHLTTGGSAAKDFSKALSKAPGHLIEPSTLHLHTNERRVYLERWSQLVSIYSRTSISFIDDRLPACSALAQQLQPILGGYAAGLWENYLPSQLLWYYDPHSGPLLLTKEQRIRRGNCPSWSWASLDRRVTLPCYFSPDPGEEFPSEYRSHAKVIDFSEIALVRILEIEVDLLGNDATGAVDGGRIIMTGRIFPVYWSAPFGYSLSTDVPSQNGNIRTWWRFDDKDAHKPDGDDDKKIEAQQPVNDKERQIMRYGSYQHSMLRRNKLIAIHAPVLTMLHCLPILLYKQGSLNGEEGVLRLNGLVIERTGVTDALYRRVGIFSCKLEHFEGFTKSTLDLQATPSIDKLTIC